MANDRKAALDAAMKKIEKNYGKGSIMKLGEKVDQQISTIPSGSLALDVALGVGGYPREKVGVMFGNPETTPGGRALKFYATVRLEVRRAEQLKNGTDIVGNRTKIKVVKNKVAPPFKVAEVDIMYGLGISQEGELLDMAVEQDIIDKSGAWYGYKEDRIGQGRENAKKYLADHPEMMAEVATRVRAAYGIGEEGDVTEAEEAGQEELPLDE